MFHSTQRLSLQFEVCLNCRLLRLLSWRLGTLLIGGPPALTRQFPFTQRFAKLPLHQRDAVLQGLYRSRLGLFRKVGLTSTLCYT